MNYINIIYYNLTKQTVFDIFKISADLRFKVKKSKVQY